MESKMVMSGAEAIVRGAMESGVRIMSGYPGYPITGIMESAKKAGMEGLHIEWAPNEKVALETVLGASVAGFRGMAVMKQVGGNVAANPLMSGVTWGVRGGVLIVAGDDPGSDGSPVEQDSRCYGFLANIPILEPDSPEEGRQMVRAAFAVSEQFGLPIILRFTKEFIAMKGEVGKGDTVHIREIPTKDMLAAFCRVWTDPAKQHYLRHEKMGPIIAEFSRFNTQEIRGNLGIITSGYSKNMVDSALERLDLRGKVSVLKLGVIPSQSDTLEFFLKSIDQVLVVEFREPIIEQEVRILSKKPVFGLEVGRS
jgi:indolepyruvate ferredoxin oxidoreductase alpha subunit